MTAASSCEPSAFGIERQHHSQAGQARFLKHPGCPPAMKKAQTPHAAVLKPGIVT